MNIEPGQGLFLKIPFFGDGEVATKARTFLVISTTENTVAMINVSSVAGKEAKILWPSNERIINHRPPFPVPSFVKLDVVYEIEYFNNIQKAVMHNSEILNNEELKRIITKLYKYQRQKPFRHTFTAMDIISCNKLFGQAITS